MYFQKTSNNAVWGKAVAMIDAPASQVLSTRFCLDSYEARLGYVESEGNLVEEGHYVARLA